MSCCERYPVLETEEKMKLDKSHSGCTSTGNTGDDSGKHPVWDTSPTQEGLQVYIISTLPHPRSAAQELLKDSIDDLTACFQKLTIHDIEMEDSIDDLTACFQKLTIHDIEMEIFEGHEEMKAKEMETCG